MSLVGDAVDGIGSTFFILSDSNRPNSEHFAFFKSRTSKLSTMLDIHFFCKKKQKKKQPTYITELHYHGSTQHNLNSKMPVLSQKYKRQIAYIRSLKK
jgi:hypothetical protein